MRDPRYRSTTGGDAYRAAVEQKIALSVTDSVGRNSEHESYVPVLDSEPCYRATGLSAKVLNPFTGRRDAQAEAAQKTELDEATKALGELLGPLAIRPSTDVVGQALPFESLPVDVV